MRKLLISMIVLSVFLGACAAPQAELQPAAVPTEAAAAIEPQPAAATEVVPTAVPEAEAQPETQPENQPEAPQPAPTSRGDALMATDPALVNLGQGQPVLVEFFRFT